MCYGDKVLKQLSKHNWRPGARYTHIHNASRFDRLGFLDIDWKSYSFEKHLTAAKKTRPVLTVARDVLSLCDVDFVKEEVKQLQNYCEFVIVVPKDPATSLDFWSEFEGNIIQGYSVPTKYGETLVPYEIFDGPVHLLGGGPKTQRMLGNFMDVVSLDNNSITIDARFGKYFDGQKSIRHPKSGRFFEDCIIASLASINKIWNSYQPKNTGVLTAINASCQSIEYDLRPVIPSNF